MSVLTDNFSLYHFHFQILQPSTFKMTCSSCLCFCCFSVGLVTFFLFFSMLVNCDCFLNVRLVSVLLKKKKIMVLSLAMFILTKISNKNKTCSPYSAASRKRCAFPSFLVTAWLVESTQMPNISQHAS